ncbi:hypothetical protein HanLR1_Chr10g0366391 [Helianthus annuus]|nr:hypothetical protein HanLR1_Chr10g0366391 [Helianthus annuus]
MVEEGEDVGGECVGDAGEVVGRLTGAESRPMWLPVSHREGESVCEVYVFVCVCL